MTLTLDHIQRLNLHALLGAQRGDVGTIRALWALQDKIALIPEEEAAIELKRNVVAGQERAIWNPSLLFPPKQFEFGEIELARIRTAIETWDRYAADADRRWLEPLIEIVAPPRNSPRR